MIVIASDASTIGASLIFSSNFLTRRRSSFHLLSTVKGRVNQAAGKFPVATVLAGDQGGLVL
jgi:hypothetical protein